MELVFLAYLRNNSVRRFIDRIKQETNFDKIYLVHDGLRRQSTLAQRRYHQETRMQILSSCDEVTKCFLYSKNIGLTQHMFRIHNDIDTEKGSLAFIEEDKLPTRGIGKYLAGLNIEIDSVGVVDTLPSKSHSSNPSYFNSMWTDNGLLVYSNLFITDMKKIYNKILDVRNEVERNLNSYLDFLGYSPKEKGYLASRLLSRVERGLGSPDRPDSLVVYTLLSKGLLYTCSTTRLVEDLSDQDDRGMNVRQVRSDKNVPCHNSFQVWTSWTGVTNLICVECERRGVEERYEPRLFRRLWRLVFLKFSNGLRAIGLKV